MNFSITEDAKNYLQNKNAKAVTISLTIPNACCGVISSQKSIYIGLPREDKLFNKIRYDGIDFYIDVFLKFNDDLVKIFLEKFLFTKTLQVENIDRDCYK